MNSGFVDILPFGDQGYQGDSKPLVYAFGSRKKNVEDLVNWVKIKKREIITNLNTHGAILFRGFPVESDIDFDAFVNAFEMNNLDYRDTLSNAVRINRTPRVFTANESPPDVSIFLHHELAQTTVYPSHLFFYCEQPSDGGGETPICRSDLLLEKLEDEIPLFVKKCSELGVCYTNIMPSKKDQDSGQGRSWQDTLSVSDMISAETILKDLNYNWKWLDDDSLKVITCPLPAIRLLPNGSKVFFNQLIAAFEGWNDKRNKSEESISFGDGSEISKEHMKKVCKLSDEISFDLSWKKNDMVIINNMMVMHGRKPFVGRRSILASLAIDDQEGPRFDS